MNTSISGRLAELNRQFATQLSARLDRLKTHFEEIMLSNWPAEVDVLHRLLHNLTGSAGTLGVQAVSEASRTLENHLAILLQADHPPTLTVWQSFGQELGLLTQLGKVRPEANAPNLKPSCVGPQLNHSPLIHVIEGDPLQASLMSQALQENGFRVEIFSDPTKFREAWANEEREAPATLIMDMIFSESDITGAQLLAELKAQPKRCPPVICSSDLDDLGSRLAALRAGVTRYMVKPLDMGHLIDLLETLTGRQPYRAYRVLMVDDTSQQTYDAILSSAGMEVRLLSEPLKILEVMEEFMPDVVVLEVDMAKASGPELAAVLRERDTQMEIPILFLSAQADMTQQLLARNLGGDDVLVKPVKPEHLIEAVMARARRARQNIRIRERFENTLYEREREHLALDYHALVSITDVKGNITYVNQKFCEVSGYSQEELLGQNHRMIKSDYHSPQFFKDFWRTIASGEVWQGEICNLRKDGSLYWVEATICPFVNHLGKPYQYVSIRTEITHTKAAEAAVRTSEARLNFLISSTPVTLYNCEPHPPYSITYVSPNIRERMGYDPQLFTQDGDFWAKNIHPEEFHLAVEGLMELPKSGSNSRDYRFKMADGSYRWINDSAQYIRNEQGEPVSITGYWADISDRKEAEQLAEAHRERLRRGQYYANIGTWEWDIATGDLYWTERIGPLFGYPDGVLKNTYENFIEAVHPDDRTAVVEAINRSMYQKVPYEVEHRVVWPDGTVRWLLERGSVVHDEQGKPIQMLGVVQDIDDRKRAELELGERAHQLREAQTMAKLGNWTENKLTGELVWSDQIYRILGYEPGSIEPNQEHFLKVVQPEDLEKVLNGRNQASLTGRSALAYRIRRPDGTICHVQKLVQAEYDAKGTLIRLCGTLQDVTEQVDTERALIAARDQANLANRAKSEFLSNMSHELRTPLNAILGFSQLMECDENLSEEQIDNVREINNAGQHLLELINEVLDLAQIESGKIGLELEPVDVCPVVEECLKLVAPLAKKHGIKITREGPSMAVVVADRIRLKQVLINLLSNAIKYNRENGLVHLEIHLDNPDWVKISIEDTGVGIAPDRIGELFKPFNRLGAPHWTEGTGIGLTITRRIVEAMDGSVDVKSCVGEGSIFWVHLPKQVAGEYVPTDEGNAALEHLPSLPSEATELATVLYIEDNQPSLKLVRYILSHRPQIRLLTAQTSRQGLELALAKRPNLVLLDINMPEMSGFEVLARLKVDPHCANTPVVALTANAMPSFIEDGLAQGFAAYLTKPLNVENFLQLIDRFLEGGLLNASNS